MTYIRRLILALALSAGLAPAFAQVAPPVPALPDTERRTSYSISASTCACAVNFALFGDSTDYANWIEVFVNGVRMTQAGNWTLSSVTGTIGSIPLPITNAVLTFTAPQTGTIQIVGARRPRRTSQFNEGAGVPTRNINVVVSDITATLREMWDKNNDMTGRGLFSQPGVTLSTLPLPSACAGKFLGFDPTGLIPQCNAGGPGSGNVVGPLSSIAGHFATWNNTTGTLLADHIIAESDLPAGIPTNALLTKTADYPIANTDCGKTIQAGTGSTGLFTITLPAVSGFPATCSVSVTNGDTARGKRLSGFPAGVNAVLWPRQTVTVGIVNGAWAVASVPGRYVISTPTTVFIDPAGNDTNDCLAAGTGACATHLQAMTNVATQFVNNSVTKLKWADATYADLIFNAQPYIGTGSIALEGNIATPANVNFTISGAGNCIFCFAYVGGNWTIHGFKLSSSVGGNGNGLYVAGNLGLVTFGNMNFGALTGGWHITAIFGGRIEQDAIYTISGGAGYHLYAADNSILHATFTGTVTITGTPAFSVAFIGSHGSGAIVGTIEANYSGAATGKSCFADDFGLIDIIDASLLPGDHTCTISTTAQVAGVFANPALGGAAYGGQGAVSFANATSGAIKLAAPAGALGTPTVLLPAANDTLVGKATTDVLTNKSIDASTNTINLRGITASLGGNVATNNATYTTGPTIAQGSAGTWFASGNVMLSSTNGDQFTCRLSDGTTVIDSGSVQIAGATFFSLSLSGFLASPAGNLQILCLNVTANRGTMNATNGVDVKASTISAIRIN